MHSIIKTAQVIYFVFHSNHITDIYIAYGDFNVNINTWNSETIPGFSIKQIGTLWPPSIKTHSLH